MYAGAALDSIYAHGEYPFYYVSLVDNMNTHAADRNVELNVTGFPTTFFDGGYQVRVGAYENIPQTVSWYTSAIIQCGDRAVPDIDASLSVTWLGNATMNIKVSVQNNEASNYYGRIRVYVTEIHSTMRWYIGGHPCHFPFLDYAFNENISVEALNTWHDSTIWNGNYHSSGHGQTFGGITQGNIMVIAAVFNTAHYVDETAAALPNQAPNTPSGPMPANGAPHVDTDADLSWTGGDPDPQDTVTYDVHFGTTTPPPLVSSDQPVATYDPGTMILDTTYFWQIVAWDNRDASTAGPIWSFITDDNCPSVYNPDQEDADGDQIGDSCDICPHHPDDDCCNPVVANLPPEVTSPQADTVAPGEPPFVYVATATDPNCDGSELELSYWGYPSWCTVEGDTITGAAECDYVDTSFNVIAFDGDTADIMEVTLVIDHSNVAPIIEPPADTLPLCAGNSFVYYPLITDPDDTVHLITYLEYPHWCSVQNDSVVGIAPDTGFVEALTVVAQDYCNADTLSFMVRTLSQGDANGDGEIDIADVLRLINYLFVEGSAPDPICTGDANCDQAVDVADVMYLINYLFIGGSPPGC